MEYLNDLVSNYLLAGAFFGWLSAQLIKVIIAIFEKPRRNLLNVLFSNGGMPSSHSSTVTALASCCAISEGISSPLFAVTMILAAIVMIDASGVRYETGKQATVIKQITEKLFSDDAESINAGLKELVGHTPLQVLMGAILGIIVAFVTGLCMGAL